MWSQLRPARQLANAFFPEVERLPTSAARRRWCMNYFAFLPTLANQGTNPNYYDKVGFFSNPKGPYGQQYASLGGQGTSVPTFRMFAAASLEFIKWFASDAVQMKWAELGGYTCNKKALASDAFLKASPYNAAIAQGQQLPPRRRPSSQ